MTSDSKQDEAAQSTLDKVGDEVDKSVHSRDEPLGKRAPGTPFALVALAYLGILAALALIASLIYFAW